MTDVNLAWLAQMLRRQVSCCRTPHADHHVTSLNARCCSQGVDLVRAEFVPDHKEDIVGTVRRLKERVGPSGVLFSSGGIGPTPDDISYESIAMALGGSPATSPTTFNISQKCVFVLQTIQQPIQTQHAAWQGPSWRCMSPRGSACTTTMRPAGWS